MFIDFVTDHFQLIAHLWAQLKLDTDHIGNLLDDLWEVHLMEIEAKLSHFQLGKV